MPKGELLKGDNLKAFLTGGFFSDIKMQCYLFDIIYAHFEELGKNIQKKADRLFEENKNNVKNVQDKRRLWAQARKEFPTPYGVGNIKSHIVLSHCSMLYQSFNDFLFWTSKLICLKARTLRGFVKSVPDLVKDPAYVLVYDLSLLHHLASNKCSPVWKKLYRRRPDYFYANEKEYKVLNLVDRKFFDEAVSSLKNFAWNLPDYVMKAHNVPDIYFENKCSCGLNV